MSKTVQNNINTKNKQLSIPPYISCIIGGIAGSIDCRYGLYDILKFSEVCIQQPTIAIKNAIQSNRSIDWSLSVLYRGLTINVLSVAPITATQFTVNNMLNNRFVDKQHNKPTYIQQLLFGSISGGISGLISGPSELILIQQQQTGYRLIQQYKYIVNNYSITPFIKRGLTSAITRDGLFACGYLGLSPVVNSIISNSQYANNNQTINNIISSLLAGVTIGILSHPFDTVKTKIQTTLTKQTTINQYNTMLQSIYTVVQQHSIKTLFDGLLPRTLRICGATFIIGQVNSTLTKLYVDKYNKTLE